MHKIDVAVIGGGAAGFFFAENFLRKAEGRSLVIFEKTKNTLSKVKISGGGRCNVTHACFEPKELVKYYPRGQKELLGPFHKFQPGDTIVWFEERGVELKIEEDGRMFPISDDSQTIVDCLRNGVVNAGGQVERNSGLREISKGKDGFILTFENRQIAATQVFFSTGSSTAGWNLLKAIGHNVVAPVPSLFTFNIKNENLRALAGVVAPNAGVRMAEFGFEEFGPLLITHWGMSGPAVLKLSARGARQFYKADYKQEVEVCWDADFTTKEALEHLKETRDTHPKKQLKTIVPFQFPPRLWLLIIDRCGLEPDATWATLGNVALEKLAHETTAGIWKMEGKSTFKEEFVTAGGVELSEIDFRTFESKFIEGLYFGGEVLNIDALTGGFNFQAAWTGAFLAAEAMAKKF